MVSFKNLYVLAGFVTFLSSTLMGCSYSYPRDERYLSFSYPIGNCTSEFLNGLAKEADVIDPDPYAETKYTNRVLCVTPPEDKKKDPRNYETAYEKKMRETVENPFTKTSASSNEFGIALSGGGSKAAAFGMGVLAGLADNESLDKATFLSSVSGGGYAAYFYYTHRLFPLTRKDGRAVPTNEALFRDCIGIDPNNLSPELKTKLLRTDGINLCNRLGYPLKDIEYKLKKGDLRFQSFVKCSQDILSPGACRTKMTGYLDLGISATAIVHTLTTIPLKFLSNTVFDWGYATSAAGKIYSDGIGLGYGATIPEHVDLSGEIMERAAIDCDDEKEPKDILDCRRNIYGVGPVPMTFSELRSGLLQAKKQPQGGLPFWIINATATQHRSAYGWIFTTPDNRTSSDMFEMTATSHGSARYGFVSAPPSIHDMTVLDAVVTSAAFFDANQQAYNSRGMRTSIALGLHLFNLDWGIDIPNYNVSKGRRQIHRSLPIPFYWLDGFVAHLSSAGDIPTEEKDRQLSSFIRLIDGGSSENLGAYALVKRNVKNILIADAGEDKYGQFSDICTFQRRISYEGEYDKKIISKGSRYLNIPGLAGFNEHCENLAENPKKPGYNLYDWFDEHPVLLGCIRSGKRGHNNLKGCENLSEDDTRLFIVKPAFNVKKFYRDQIEYSNLNELQLTQIETKITGPLQLKDCLIRGAGISDYSLINCDTASFLVANQKEAGCHSFPQDSTPLITANSNPRTYVAYRELARQYVSAVSKTNRITDFLNKDKLSNAILAFEETAEMQRKNALSIADMNCSPYVSTGTRP